MQLLGYTVSGSFGGLLHNHMVSRQGAWNDMLMMKQFMVTLMENQKSGIKSHIHWPDQGFDFDCALGDLSINESVDQTGFQYSISFQVVNQSAMRSGANMSSVFDLILTKVGFKSPGTDGAYHGGGGDTEWLRKQVYVSGMGSSGPGVSSSTDDSYQSSVNVSGDSSIEELKKYARDLVLNKYHWTEADYNALVELWNHESNWSYKADNPYSDALGIPQAMYNQKTHPELFNYPEYKDFKNNPKTQINWGLWYISTAYGNPSKAWAHWQARVPIDGKDVGNWY